MLFRLIIIRFRERFTKRLPASVGVVATTAQLGRTQRIFITPPHFMGKAKNNHNNNIFSFSLSLLAVAFIYLNDGADVCQGYFAMIQHDTRSQ